LGFNKKNKFLSQWSHSESFDPRNVILNGKLKVYYLDIET
jgi:hypothetical protein